MQKDGRHFSRPILHHVNVPMSTRRQALETKDEVKIKYSFNALSVDHDIQHKTLQIKELTSNKENANEIKDYQSTIKQLMLMKTQSKDKEHKRHLDDQIKNLRFKKKELTELGKKTKLEKRELIKQLRSDIKIMKTNLAKIKADRVQMGRNVEADYSQERHLKLCMH
jgi:hypothetical protein